MEEMKLNVTFGRERGLQVLEAFIDRENRAESVTGTCGLLAGQKRELPQIRSQESEKPEEWCWRPSGCRRGRGWVYARWH